MTPTVSIVILNYNHPELITKCLETMCMTSDVDYEVVVVDNGSDAATVECLKRFESMGWITKLVLNTTNKWFSEGNNIGVANTNPESKYILLLNSDVAFLRPDWLSKMIAWMEGVPDTEPSVWGFKPTVPTAGPRDIVSIGWSYDENLPSKARPEGWCLMFRRKAWREFSPDFPHYYGIEEAVAKSIREGNKAGVLFNYANYLVHREQGSEAHKIKHLIHNKRQPDMKAWYSGLNVETLDFTLGEWEHDSYLAWSYLLPLVSIISLGSLLC
jgi:glycosyltransferase involved in cell wall biosynthesis